MNIKNLKIGTQIGIGFAALFLFVIVLGGLSYWQTDQIALQTETIFDHPMQVRVAIGRLEADVLSMRLGTRDLILANADAERQDALQLIEVSSADALQQFDVLYSQYLGPRSDIDEAYKAFMNWKIALEENARLAFSGEIEKVKESILSTGTVGVYSERMMTEIKNIDDFALTKSNSLYEKSFKLSNTLHWQLVFIVFTVLILSMLVYYFLLRNIRIPLNILIDASLRFKNGDLNARSNYTPRNEFGSLSDSFNEMVESIQLNKELSEKVANLAALMLSEYDAKKFFRTTLSAMATHTGSQMAAIYLLNNDKQTFDHFESVGIDINARKSFKAEGFEGEFGAVLSTGKVQHIKNIAEDTRFVFQTVSGKFIPREIITLPITADNEIIAIISLASVSKYNQQSLQLIDNILVTLCSRVEGIMAYHKIKEFSKKLEQQNTELDAQKTELAAQSTELIEQNTELVIQKNQLNEVSRLKTNFLSNMSHELRTPLNSVIALSSVLNRRLAKKIPDEEFSYLEVIERNGKNLLALINDILDISRIEAGHEEIDNRQFNVNKLVADVVTMIDPQARQKNIGLYQEITNNEIYMTSDEGKCRHILQNLIGNAVKFTEKGNIKVVVTQHGQTIEIKVSDSGIGISKENISHIFDEFRQADGSTSRRFGGTGLGLAIAKKYANLLGGDITVTSQPDVGSEFTLSLPELNNEDQVSIRKAEKNRNDKKNTISETPSGSTHSEKTILLVEDSEPAIIQIRDMLEEKGYQLSVAHDGEQALDSINQFLPNAIILDLMMPGIDGFEVLRTIREPEHPASNIPVLILTAKHITKEELNFLKGNNIHQYIRKGDVNRNELLQAVAAMVSDDNHKELPAPIPQSKAEKPVVLIVEDNPDNMVTVSAILRDIFTIIEAVNGNEAVEMAEKHKPDLILMDIALPGIDGITAFKKIRSKNLLHHIPVIALTASAMMQDRESILSHGFDGYIAKPIDELYFFKTINEVMYGK